MHGERQTSPIFLSACGPLVSVELQLWCWDAKLLMCGTLCLVDGNIPALSKLTLVASYSEAFFCKTYLFKMTMHPCRSQDYL